MDNEEKDMPPANQDGFSHATLIVSVVACVVLLATILFFSRYISQMSAEYDKNTHFRQEIEAYRFTWVKNQLNQMQQRCASKTEKIEMWQKFYTQSVKKDTPVELLTGANQNDCLIEQMPNPEEEVKKKKEGE